MSDGMTDSRSNNYPTPSGVYRHDKGGLYVVLAVLDDAGDRDNKHERLVGYLSLEDGRKYWRSLYDIEDGWMVPRENGNDRFVHIGYADIHIDSRGKYNVTRQL
jgi:hypothetical protein